MRDHHDAGGVARAHDVTLIHLAKPKLPRYRRGHARVGELQSRAIHLSLVDLDRAFELAHQRLLAAHLLFGNRVLLEQHAVTLEINARIGKQGLITLHLPFGLQQLRLKRARIDFGEQVAFLHHLPFLEQHAHQLSIDAAAHGDGAQRRYRTQAIEIHMHAAAARKRDGHRCYGASAALAFALGAFAVFAFIVALGVGCGGIRRRLIPLLIGEIATTTQCRKTHQPYRGFRKN